MYADGATGAPVTTTGASVAVKTLMLATGAAVREVLCVFGAEVTTVRTGGWMGVAVGSSYGSAVGACKRS